VALEPAPVELDAPGVRADHPEENVHQGGLAGAVLAEETDDAPGRNDELDIAIGADRAERLRNAGHAEHRCSGSFYG
jgi:hypothetical protein